MGAKWSLPGGSRFEVYEMASPASASSATSSSSSTSAALPRRSSLADAPMERARPGSRDEPKMSSTTTRMISSSGPPRFLMNPTIKFPLARPPRYFADPSQPGDRRGEPCSGDGQQRSLANGSCVETGRLRLAHIRAHRTLRFPADGKAQLDQPALPFGEGSCFVRGAGDIVEARRHGRIGAAEGRVGGGEVVGPGVSVVSRSRFVRPTPVL